jgi:hypothetical protein
MSEAEVNAWFGEYEHPLKDVMMYVREIILAADSRVGECIKWKSPTFVFKGNIASFNPRTKKHVSLMFHTGASIKGEFPHLIGGGNTARYMTFSTRSETESLREELTAIIQSWCKQKSES